MIGIALALALSPTAGCQIDRTLPPELTGWRITRSALLDSNYIENGAFEYRDLPPAAGQTVTRHFSTASGGTYAVAIDRDAPVSLYGGDRDANGKRVAIVPVAIKGGPACSSIAAVRFYQLPPGNYYARAEGLDRDGARTMVVRLD